MADPGEIISSLFTLAVGLFVILVLTNVLLGNDISGLVNTFSDFIPGFVVFLVILFIIVRIVAEL